MLGHVSRGVTWRVDQQLEMACWRAVQDTYVHAGADGRLSGLGDAGETLDAGTGLAGQRPGSLGLAWETAGQ